MKRSELRALAVQRTLFVEPTLERALTRLRFVQADPIRAPARAQDLILRVRTPDYRAGELESRFAELDLVEDMLHVYGFLPRAEDAYLHPRSVRHEWSVDREHPHLRRAILRFVRARGSAHPRDLHTALGRVSMPSGWGSGSAATTRALDMLHYEGHLRVVRREAGIKVFGIAHARQRALAPAVRAQSLLRLLANLYAPLPAARLCQLYRKLGSCAPARVAADGLVEGFVKRGEWRRDSVDGVDYVWPIEALAAPRSQPALRLLAPFDPLVWDRARFEHLWGWPYRFEAYTPPAKRQLGYYALPLLWQDAVIGWANVTRAGERWRVEPGFVGARPRARAFERSLEEEVERLERFLGTPCTTD
jgi:uncharacterized protein YcaQ